MQTPLLTSGPLRALTMTGHLSSPPPPHALSLPTSAHLPQGETTSSGCPVTAKHDSPTVASSGDEGNRQSDGANRILNERILFCDGKYPLYAKGERCCFFKPGQRRLRSSVAGPMQIFVPVLRIRSLFLSPVLLPSHVLKSVDEFLFLFFYFLKLPLHS